MTKYNKKGISLIILVITIIVIIIIAGVIILSLNNYGILDNAKKARFMSDFKSVEEGVTLYSSSKYNTDTGKFDLPVKGYLTEDDKTYIKENVPTLNTKIEELSGNLDLVNLAWISSEDISVKLSTLKEEKGYILDVATGQIYDYIGDVFEGKRWHTLEGGVLESEVIKEEVQEMWDGWIRLTLYYPSNSTAREWRLGTEGEVRLDPILMWQGYTGPITIPLDRTKDVWIKYKIDDKEVIIPPAGTLLVDIAPDKTGATKVSQVKIKISYDEGATTKEYRVGSSGWLTYTGEFSVTENCIIEARAKKKENIYDTNGILLVSRDIAGKDAVYIGNIGTQTSDPGGSGSDTLVAPTITRLAPQNAGEKAKVSVTYPANADKKIYKSNYGIEQEYTEEISVTEWGTHIIAYYYDVNSLKSKSTSIYINDTSSGASPESPKPHEPSPVILPGNPAPTIPVDANHVIIPAPTINISPTGLVEQVSVSLSAPTSANKIYIKLGRYGEYKEYTTSIIVRENMEVYAYYRTSTGEKSETANALVNNIKKLNKPYVVINANPYPWGGLYGIDKVTVTIAYSDTTKIEYSEDGIVYLPYTSPFEVTKNKRIYAKGTNINGITETYLDITNIGNIDQPPVMQNLAISINVEPEPTLSNTKVAKAKVSIEYDLKATGKYYRIDGTGELLEYTAPFDVTSNCTIYAYAISLNGKGSSSKVVDNLLNGISTPIITTSPNSNVQSSNVNVNIQYDKYATIKRYSIDGGALRDYGSTFDVTKNETVIYAYSENIAGQKSNATYKVQNIVADPPVVVLDKGKYYILKLSYPATSVGREYKWKETGDWKEYKEAGIILVKPEYKDDLIVSGTLIKIEDENGKLITFTGDYYLVDVPISELFENVFMRWDRVSLGAPQITLNTTDPAKQVVATIIYNPALINKQYRILNPGEQLGEWQNYTGPITIDTNNAIIYAKGMDDSEVWSAEGMYKVTNIDETAPIITLTADLILAQQKVAIKVIVKDDVEVGKVKWIAGTQGESYFENAGTEILNNSIVNIISNGYYTFYAEDRVGNKQVYTLNVTNVDLNPPLIDIQVSPETTVGITTNITINYGDSTVKQYKLGTNNATWLTYTNTFTMTSNTVLANNWKNADGTVTVYAKGKDTAGNEVIVEKKILSLDLDKPISPVIISNAGYPIITSSGINYNKATTITYDTRTDIDNYYSINNGVNWLRYSGQFDMINGTVIAKSVKKNTGLEVSVSKTITMATDALGLLGYDGDNNTSISCSSYIGLIKVDDNMIGKSVNVKASTGGSDFYVKFLNASNQVITTVYKGQWIYFDEIYVVPANTKWIKIENSSAGNYAAAFYEIQTSNEPKFTATNGYMTLHADPTKSIKEAYQMVNISYFITSVQRLYRIGTTGNWLNYNDQDIKVIHGQTIYSKGIDQNGNETRSIASYTSNVANALGILGFDGNTSTSIPCSGYSGIIQVDDTMVGKDVNVIASTGGSDFYVRFLNASNQIISSIYKGQWIYFNEVYNIPANTKWIKIENTNGGNYPGAFYEIQPSNEPKFTATNGYMLLHADLTKAIKEAHAMVNISYFTTSVQKLYRIGTTGDWLNYNNQAIRVNNGATIYAKGIDQYGKETRVVSSYTPNVTDALSKEAFDGNYGTYVSMNNISRMMQVDGSMDGKTVRIRAETQGTGMTVAFLQQNLQQIGGIYRGEWKSVNELVTVPINTRWIRVQFTSGSYAGLFYEIQPE